MRAYVNEKRNTMSPSGSPTLGELIELARGGNQSALGQLLELSRNYLKLLARLQIDQQLQGKADPSDVVQETFMEALRDFNQFRGCCEKEWLGWLRQVLVSNLANLVRRYRGTKSRDIRLERKMAVQVDQSSQVLERGLQAPVGTPSELLSDREESLLLANALEGLSAEYREAIILRHLEGLSFPEVAQKMDRTVDSVKKLWARGLIQLRCSLGGRP